MSFEERWPEGDRTLRGNREAEEKQKDTKLRQDEKICSVLSDFTQIQGIRMLCSEHTHDFHMTDQYNDTDSDLLL